MSKRDLPKGPVWKESGKRPMKETCTYEKRLVYMKRNLQNKFSHK